MTPQELLKKIEDLQIQVNALKSTTTIPLEIGNAMTERIVTDTFKKSAVSSPTADGYLQANIGGELMYIPKYK
jgi:hypothetical protein